MNSRYFVGTEMITTAIKSIEANQPIFDNYGPQFIKTDRDDRRFKLSGRYWFHCTCNACINDWPILQKMNSMEIIPNTKEEKCALKSLKQIEPLYFETAMKAMELGKPETAIELLKKFIQEAEKILESHKDSSMYPYKTVMLAEQAIQLCYCSLGSVHFAQI